MGYSAFPGLAVQVTIDLETCTLVDTLLFLVGHTMYHCLRTGTLVATLPGAWRYRVNARTGGPQCKYAVDG